jgi:hypothetical protein
MKDVLAGLKLFACYLHLLIVVGVLSSALVLTNQAGAQQIVGAKVRKEILDQLLKDHRDLVVCLEEEGPKAREEYLANVSVEEIDLNGDNRTEFLVEPQGGCSCGAQNCSRFVYRRAASGYEMILEGNGLGLTPEKSLSSGYRDISIDAHDSALTQFRTLYKFDGQKYRESRTDFINMETGEVKPAERRVQFARGQTSATVTGKVKLGFGDTYTVGARAGQTMTVQLGQAAKTVTFSIMTPDAKRFLIDRATKWTGTLPETGEYRILVDADERGGTYSMTMTIR